MKRGAEKQLRREEAEADDDEEPEEIRKGFKKADESELARRKIRALPKRMGGTEPAPASAPGPATTNGAMSNPSTRFGGFGGFGTGGSSPFSFAQPVPSPILPTNTVKPAPAPSFSAFATPTNLPASASPSVSSSASAATKSFAAFLGPTPTSTSSSSSPAASNTAANGTEDTAAFKYYTSLRGLNVSFIKTITKAVAEDPFMDVASLMESYKSLRIAVQSEFDMMPKDPLPSMPAPPANFAGSGSLVPSSSSSSGSGFTSKIDSGSSSTNPSGFSFSSAAAPSSSDQPPGFSFPSAAPLTSSAPSKLPFSFSSLAASSLKPSPEGTGASDTSKSDNSSKPSGSSFTFGSSTAAKSDATTSAFSFPPPPGDKKDSPPAFFGSAFSFSKDKGADKSSPVTNLFGGSSAFGTSTPTKSDKDKPLFSGGFSFGTGATPPKVSAFSGFGKPSGSIGNPVGFGFGSPPKSESDGDATLKLTFPSSSFTFGQPKKEEAKEGEESEEKVMSGGEAAVDAEDADAPKTVSNSIHDLEGQGEEDEETTHSVKSKVYRFTKNPDDEKGKWVDMGVGVLKLKKHKETDARRMLLRNTSTGRVIINFKIYAGLTPKVNSKLVSFTGHEEGQAVNYQLRVKTTEDAEQLNQALNREIEFIKGQFE
ncbi:hypothetical protein NEOLEDRAFT_1175356 [Neolentinus lepideus HHB14362 ss-1]|uniref:RanBD1 domain-containing protein n=1 Tax=Neolentinus lepideus HHB14362 ss-1 TaxID=1314782 RepID=A0A165V1S6_9AGAM|nr:hypothetical protein NEOLEDRAFT_1175356 [Neolentinus lepideus HHB14362 ss-1]